MRRKAPAGGNDAFSYDQANRLTQAVVSGGTSTTSAYAYNGDGVRVSKQVSGQTTATTRYVWDLAGGLPVLLEDGTRRYVWGAAGAGLGLAYNVTVGSGTVEVYHQDHLGSVRELTDSQGHVTSIYLTDEYGVPSTLEGPDGTPATASDQPFWFTGELFDGGPKRPGEPGLLYLRARHYEPDTGRFTSRDSYSGSLRSPQSLNRYTYTENNPCNRRDPRGLSPADAGCRIVWVQRNGILVAELRCDGPEVQPTQSPQSQSDDIPCGHAQVAISQAWSADNEPISGRATFVGTAESYRGTIKRVEYQWTLYNFDGTPSTVVLPLVQ